jgi:hypothetical protein
MKIDQKQKLSDLIELANQYPSPHNGQPIVLVASDEDTTINIYFDTTRGLTATPISYLFSFITIGVFIRHLEHCGQALGHQVTILINLPEQCEMASGKLLFCGTIRIRYDALASQPEKARLLHRRQTSRKKYTAGLSEEQIEQIKRLAAKPNQFVTILPREIGRQTIWLNQRAVFDAPVRNELHHWLRYTKEEKDAKRDGLAYDCMELSGSALRFVVDHYRVLHWPIVSQALKQYYSRTMVDESTVGYLTAPFTTEKEAYDIGRSIIDIWLELSIFGAYLHPFGTIVSNEKAHRDFLDLVSFDDETRSNYVVFIFRAGFSDQPVESDRIAVSNHLFKGQVV